VPFLVKLRSALDLVLVALDLDEFAINVDAAHLPKKALRPGLLAGSESRGDVASILLPHASRPGCGLRPGRLAGMEGLGARWALQRTRNVAGETSREQPG
jgi:hypothetical protein